MKHTGIVRTTTITGVVAALSLAAVVPALASAPTGDPVTTVADLDGDGEIETVSAQLTGAGDQVVSATVHGTFTSIHLGADTSVPLEAPRVADLNGDGRAELIVTQSVGANTTFFTALHYDGHNLAQVVGNDGKPLSVAEGGGVAAHLGYQCTPFEGGRAFETVAAEADDVGADPLTYSGTRTVYTLRDGALTTLKTIPITSRPVTDPVLSTDTTSCDQAGS
ncbi:VCBS repeat-containing protein [Amycolatopsis sp. EV170708-02-1]|uniref:FG-GAP repeat domain-containing protein n=1 Tax=Amycolatopsis sp. EV170708-02-1 TaxID=2919322 RepID=UPI001F0C33C2|nr:VCBS repeat-containing protein [Amycolatopsis sp. EV170708-02-1]UMP01422.1 VCBS repeat-containing protein [Amycolatopsis sp. EV170708-02-1]